MADRLTLGRVAGVYGVKGWVRLQSFTRPMEQLLAYAPWWVARGDGFQAGLVEGRVHGGGLVARLCDAAGTVIEDRDVAAGLIGAELQVERSRMPPTAPGEYYWFDLVGLAVRNAEGVVLGRVESLTSNGAQDVLVVRDGEVLRLIPFVQGPIVQSVDVQGGLIVVDWQPEY